MPEAPCHLFWPGPSEKRFHRFLHGLGYSKEGIALALDLEVREVDNNLKGTSFGCIW